MQARTEFRQTTVNGLWAMKSRMVNSADFGETTFQIHLTVAACQPDSGYEEPSEQGHEF
jgi:hypothetical protein